MNTMLVEMPLAISDFRHPNTFVWKHNARVNQSGLRQKIGEAAYELFAESVWPDETVDMISWSTICHQARAAYFLAARGERDLTKLIEAAKAVQG